MKQQMSKPIHVTYFPKSHDSGDMQDHETALSCVSLALQGLERSSLEIRNHTRCSGKQTGEVRDDYVTSRGLGRGWCYSRDNQRSPVFPVSEPACVADCILEWF